MLVPIKYRDIVSGAGSIDEKPSYSLQAQKAVIDVDKRARIVDYDGQDTKHVHFSWNGAWLTFAADLRASKYPYRHYLVCIGEVYPGHSL